MIIGLTGTKASGKGEIAKILEKKGFRYYSLSDEVREEAKQRGMENYTIKNLQDIGNELRERYGNGVWAKRIIQRINSAESNVIDGIRNIGEIEELNKEYEFNLIAVDVSQEKRFDRLFKRARPSDPKNIEALLEMDKRDLGMDETNSGQQVSKCMELANYKINNEGDVYDLYENVLGVLAEIRGRPSWDGYFMKMASLVAERSTCLRHHVGAIVVKDKRVVATGYNGAAAGLEDCIKKGCLRDELNIPSGERHEICRAIHAEQNAIIQVGKDKTNDGTLYCTHTPCMICAKMIVQAGIKKVFSYNNYADEEARKFLETSGVNLKTIERPSNLISFKD